MKQGNIALLLELKVQSMGFFLSGSLEPEEKNIHLDQAYSDFIDEVLSNLRKIEANGGSFESNSVRLDELRTLKTRTADPIAKSGASNALESWFDLPTGYRDYVRILAEVTDTDNTTPIYKMCRVLDSSVLTKLSEDTFHKSKYKSPVAEIEDTNVIVHLKDFVCNNIKMIFIKEPIAFDVQGSKDDEYIISSKTLYRVVDKAALLAIPDPNAKAQVGASLQVNKLL